MRNLNWIKDFYAFDKHVTVPSVRTRYISLFIVGSFGMYAWLRYANGAPMLLAVVLAFFMFFEPINLKFFKVVSIVLQGFFQTLRIVVMTIFYYTAFALSAIYFRRTQLKESSFLVQNSSTLRKIDKLQLFWQKMW